MKFLITCILVFSYQLLAAQSITNTLASGGTFTIEDDGGADLHTITNAGIIQTNLKTGTTFSIQDAGANNLFYVEESGNTTSTVSSAGFNIDDDGGNQIINAKFSSEPRIQIGDHSGVSSSRQLSIVQNAGTAGIELYSFLASGFSSFSKFSMYHSRGTATAQLPLHFGDELGQVTWFGKGTGAFESSAGIQVYVGDSPQDASSGAISISTAPSYIAFIASDNSGNDQARFYVNGDGTIQIPGLSGTGEKSVKVDANGNLVRQGQSDDVGIGLADATVPSAKLHVLGTVRLESYTSGTATFDASGNVTSSSDERLKNIKGKFTRGINSLMEIEPITYQWNELSKMETNGFYTGFSAQNVQKWIPEAVGQNSEGYLSLDNRPIIATLVNAVQEQQEEIEALKKEVSRLETELDDRLAKLEKNIDKLSKKQDKRLAKK